MGELKIQDKEIVSPGQILAAGMDYLPTAGTLREGEDIVASQLGIVSINGRLIKVIPLTGKYFPKVGDTIIGKVVEMSFGGWYLDIGCAYDAMLPLKEVPEYIERDSDLTRHYDYGEYICAIVSLTLIPRLVEISMKGGPSCRKLRGGKIIQVSSNKVPRIIGKQGSMVSMIKELTGCRIVVGQNGWVWIQGENPKMELLVTNAIKKIEEEAHKEGLTESIKAFLEKETGIKLKEKEIKEEIKETENGIQEEI